MKFYKPDYRKYKRKRFWRDYKFLRKIGRSHKQAKRGAGVMARDRHFQRRLKAGRRF